MSKPDEAHVLTDQQLKELEKRISSEYKKAADELTDKINAYFESFKKRDAETKSLIGTIVNGREYTEKDYQQWRLAQIGRGKRFEALRDRVAERDAAVEFLRTGKSRCDCCMHDESSINEYPCRDCKDCGGMSDYWQWRGVRK